MNLPLRLRGIVVRLPGQSAPLFRLGELKIPFGSRWLFEGPSGCGKSTLLHLLAGILTPDEGDVWLGEDRLSHLDEAGRARARRQHYGIVFQRLNLIDYLTAEENVTLASTDAARAREALKRVGLADATEKRVAAMSLGEQQRVAVARVLAAAPPVILADEPTSSLDDKNAHIVADALWEASEGRTLIVVSHDQRLKDRFPERRHFSDVVKA